MVTGTAKAAMAAPLLVPSPLAFLQSGCVFAFLEPHAGRSKAQSYIGHQDAHPAGCPRLIDP
jgi:hypothetical protein